MFIERLLNQGPTPVLQQVADFTEQRHRLLAENVANVDTPEYRQKDMSVAKFQQALRRRIEQRGGAPLGSVSFADVSAEVENPERDILYHDGNNRSMEQLMTDEAKNALLHNFVIELMRKQYQQMDMALKERVG